MFPEGHKKCFIIMPFGERVDHAGHSIDFDAIYRDVFLQPITDLGFEAVRCDMISHAGSIHRDMFTHIAVDDLALVDITTSNPNVFYELGVRHAMRPSMTILTKARGATVPFNIQGERIIEYPGGGGDYAEPQEQIRKFIMTGLMSKEPDSPIFTVLRNASRDTGGDRIREAKEHAYRVRRAPDKRISVITGGITDWSGIDVWVNSENTNMQMARYYDRSMSAVIRYEGATKDDNGEVLADTIADELAAVLGDRESVTPGTVYVTGAGDLTATRGVKKVFHAATVHGAPGGGYRMIHNVERCVGAALRRIDERYSSDGLRTIVFPLLGTGEGGGNVHAVAPLLIQAAISYFVTTPASVVEKVYFSAWRRRELDACQAALERSSEVEPIAT